MNFVNGLKNYFRILGRQNYELIWARTWDDTKKEIEWIEKMPGISPGRWAVGYNYLYVMTRVLNELEPHNVLDLGLGISSTLISHYFDYKKYEDGMHTIVEHNSEWIKFYSVKNRISDVSEILLEECIKKNFDNCEYYAYKDLGTKLKGRKYSVISIDAPMGGTKHSRRDVVELLPDILEENFVIIIDDAQRQGERATIGEIEKVLKDNKIEYCKGMYPGLSDCCVLTSKNNSFICSM